MIPPCLESENQKDSTKDLAPTSHNNNNNVSTRKENTTTTVTNPYRWNWTRQNTIIATTKGSKHQRPVTAMPAGSPDIGRWIARTIRNTKGTIMGTNIKPRFRL